METAPACDRRSTREAVTSYPSRPRRPRQCDPPAAAWRSCPLHARQGRELFVRRSFLRSDVRKKTAPMQAHFDGRIQFDRIRAPDDFSIRAQTDGVAAFEDSKWTQRVERVRNA